MGEKTGTGRGSKSFREANTLSLTFSLSLSPVMAVSLIKQMTSWAEIIHLDHQNEPRGFTLASGRVLPLARISRQREPLIIQDDQDEQNHQESGPE